MEERRRGGFRVKPSFGQVLGYIQEGEPLALDLPKRNASLYTSSHFYLDDYPNAPSARRRCPTPASIRRLRSRQPTRAAMGSPSRALHEAVLPARQRRWGHGSRPGPPRKRHPSRGDGDCGRRCGRDEERLGEPDDERAARRRRLAGPHAQNPQTP